MTHQPAPDEDVKRGRVMCEPLPNDEPAWKHKLRSAALLALQRREEERKRRELAEVLRDWARREEEKEEREYP